MCSWRESVRECFRCQSARGNFYERSHEQVKAARENSLHRRNKALISEIMPAAQLKQQEKSVEEFPNIVIQSETDRKLQRTRPHYAGGI